jgi:type II secretory pathway pseudopilin PulG
MKVTISPQKPRVIKRSTSTGFTYIGLLAAVAIMGIFMMVVGEVWQTLQKREKESELLFIGNEYRRAITDYYMHTPGTAPRYVMKLEELLKDARYPVTRRYLRKLYKDPLTRTGEWGLLKNANGQIYGVYSLSTAEPFKKEHFKKDDHDFEGRGSYAEWVFKYVPTQATANTGLSAGATTQASPLATPKPNTTTNSNMGFSNGSFSNQPKTPVRR